MCKKKKKEKKPGNPAINVKAICCCFIRVAGDLSENLKPRLLAINHSPVNDSKCNYCWIILLSHIMQR